MILSKFGEGPLSAAISGFCQNLNGGGGPLLAKILRKIVFIIFNVSIRQINIFGIFNVSHFMGGASRYGKTQAGVGNQILPNAGGGIQKII